MRPTLEHARLFKRHGAKHNQKEQQLVQAMQHAETHNRRKRHSEASNNSDITESTINHNLNVRSHAAND